MSAYRTMGRGVKLLMLRAVPAPAYDRRGRVARRHLLMVVGLVLLAGSAQAVVLCARLRADGSFNASVKIRPACSAHETQLGARALGVQGPKEDLGSPGQRLLVEGR